MHHFWGTSSILRHLLNRVNIGSVKRSARACYIMGDINDEAMSFLCRAFIIADGSGSDR